MDNNVTKALLAGLFFGVWPLLMNRSGLGGNLSSLAFASIVTLCVAPFALKNVGDISGVSWAFVVGAGVMAAIGVLFFNGMLANATPQNVSTLFVVMIVAQAVVPAVYGIIMNGGKVSMIRLAGFTLAIAASVLLTMKEKA